MLKNDLWIIEQAKKGMISPFEAESIRKIKIGEFETIPALSYGTDSYGYNLRLSPKSFKVFKHIPGEIVDPKNFNLQHLEEVELKTDENGSFFVIPSNSYALGLSIERFEIPDNITTICLGKSTYARVAIIVNVTPFEAGWKGTPTLEFSNNSRSDVKIYANEGVCQLLFLEGEPCKKTYEDRKGKYQNQPNRIVVAKV